MKKSAVIIIPLLVVLTLLFLVSRWWEPAPVGKKQLVTTASSPAQENSPPDSAPATSPPKPPPTLEEGRSATDSVSKMITAFHTRMGENPVGTNAEITKALMGENPVHATFSQEPPTLNAKGELIDPWGTPYFFHQISGNEMVIISAGPDKIMGTADDIVEK
jgi:hypothetical protein